jgi:hypothetical protein
LGIVKTPMQGDPIETFRRLGWFGDERVARVAHDLAALSLHGKFAHFNILTREYAAAPDHKVEVAA